MKNLSIFTFLLLLTGLHNATARQTTMYVQDSTVIEHSNAAIRTVKTLSGAYFNSSLDNDRLGGSKIGFISEDVILKAEEANDGLYRIILSNNRYAYMPKEMVTDTIVDASILQTCASQSMNISNRGTYDRVKIGLPVKKPYIIRENSNPRQLIIELFGVQNNSNWITQYLNLKSVENIEAIQTDSDVLTLVVNLKGHSSWGYSAKYEENNLVVDIKHAPKFSLKGLTIGIDAGHGGPDSNGAIGRTTMAKEKDLNLSMALMLKDILESHGAKTVLSRNADVGMTMAERKRVFIDNNIDLLISIHCNAGGRQAHGTSTYYKHIQNRELAKQILDRLVKINGVNLFGLVGNFNFSLNAPTEYPAILVETLFLSYKPDEEKIVNPDFRKKMMKQVAKGIKDYLKYCKKAEKEKR